MIERECRGHLEEGAAQAIDQVALFLDERDDGVRGNRMLVDENTLPKIDEVWRGVATDATPLRSQKRVQGRDTAALAVRPGNVKDAELLVRIAECAQQLARALEAKTNAARRARKEVVERLLVGGQAETQPVAAGRPVMWRSS
jgi:hypothetical protein